MATRLPWVIKYFPKASIKVLLPTPGTPVIPILIEFPECGRIDCTISLANTLSVSKLLSIIVIARDKRTLSPFKTPSIYSFAASLPFVCSSSLILGYISYYKIAYDMKFDEYKDKHIHKNS